MKIKTILNIIFVIVLSNSCSSNSTKPYSGNLTTRNEHFLDGLKKLDDGTTDAMALNTSILFYTIDGILIPQLEVIKNTYSGNYVVHSLYVDQNNQLKLAIITPITDEIKKRRQSIDDAKGKPNLLLGKEAIPFNIKDIDGNEYTENRKGDVIVLNFWFTACAPCVREIPELNKLVKKFNNKKIVFLAIATDKKEHLITFLNKHPFSYHVVAEGNKVTEDYKALVAPTHVIIDKNSIIKYYHSGSFDSISIKDFENEIDKVLI